MTLDLRLSSLRLSLDCRPGTGDCRLIGTLAYYQIGTFSLSFSRPMTLDLRLLTLDIFAVLLCYNKLQITVKISFEVNVYK